MTTTETPRSWRDAWHAAAPLLSTRALEALACALEIDDQRLGQGYTTTPPALRCVEDWPVESACLLAYCGWQGEELPTVGAVEEYFAQLCFKIDQHMEEPAGCRWLLNWFDETPREEMRRQLLPEVLAELQRRRAAPDA